MNEIDEHTQIERLDRASEIADARLHIAEMFSWPVAMLFASVVLLKWDSWLLSIGAGVVGFILSVYQLRKESDAAEDAHMKATKTGRYYEGPPKIGNHS